MTHRLRCGPTAPPTLRGSGAQIEGPQTGERYPYAGILFPIGGIPPPFTGSSYCAARSFSPKPPLLCHSLRLPSGAWGLTPQPSDPMTPHVYSWASALSLWGISDRVPRFPDHQRRGKTVDTVPYPTFGTRSQSTSSLTCPGRPTSPPGSPPGMWIRVERPLLSDRAPR